MLTTGNGTSTTPLKEQIGLVTKTLSITCAKKHLKLFMNLNLMVCHSLETRKEKSTNVPLEAKAKNLEKVVRPTEPAQLLIELDIACCILSLEEPLDTTAFSLLSTLHSISLWTGILAEVSCATIWPMELFTE